MRFEWSQLNPLEPVGRDDGPGFYVEPPHNTARRLVELLVRPGSRVALWGPVGSGKSTEFNRASSLLVTPSIVCPIPLDQDHDLRHSPASSALHGSLFVRLAGAAVGAGVQLSPPLFDRLNRLKRAGGVEPKAFHAAPGDTRDLLRELRSQASPVFLVDGLEKAPEAVARDLLHSLDALAQEGAALAVVMSPALVTGPEAYEVVQGLGYQDLPLRAVPVSRERHGAAGAGGRGFFVQVALRRLGDGPGFATIGPLVEDVAEMSGGVPRTFLQLLRDVEIAAAYANRDVPDADDLAEVVQNHRLTLRRLLREGDLAVLREHSGTSGLEVPIERRIRLLAQGLLLEYALPDRLDPVVEPHPLLMLGR